MTPSAAPAVGDNRRPLIQALEGIVGKDHVITDAEERAFYSTDVFYKPEPAELVVQPGTPEEVAAVVRTATQAGMYVVPRGGGMSYTKGYAPERTDSVIIDTRRLNRIIEINAEDMYVTVECGVTWKQLYEALKEKGLRTPYFGPFSGMYATVGGVLSQNSIFFGSSTHGTAVESVLGLEVALADGRLVKTGSWATPHNPSAFFRHYGPDLGGIFLGDTGAMGFKVRASLRLLKTPEICLFGSFDFPDDVSMTSAMSQIGREGLASECFGFDPYLLSMRMKFEGLAKDFKALGSVVKSGKTLLGGLKDAAKIAVAGRRFADDVSWAMHVTVEGRDQASADSALKRVKAIAAQFGATEIEPSMPKLVRSMPFAPVNRLLGPEGERWVPIHVILPHSRAQPVLRAIDAFFNERKQLVEENKIEWGYLMTIISTNAILFEPTFFWPDSHYSLHTRMIEKSHYAKLKQFPENLKARNALLEIRQGLARLFMEHGCVHLQIGKMYPFLEGREPETRKLLQQVKDLVDPQHMVNPGSLGLR